EVVEDASAQQVGGVACPGEIERGAVVGALGLAQSGRGPLRRRLGFRNLGAQARQALPERRNARPRLLQPGLGSSDRALGGRGTRAQVCAASGQALSLALTLCLSALSGRDLLGQRGAFPGGGPDAFLEGCQLGAQGREFPVVLRWQALDSADGLVKPRLQPGDPALDL